MKWNRFATLVLPAVFGMFLSASLTACGDDGEEGDGDGDGGAGGGDGDGDGDGATSWLGEDPHLDVAGTVAGEAFDLEAEGEDAADVGTLYCERNYIVPDLEDMTTWTEGYLQKVEFKFNYSTGEAFAEFQMELEAEDLPSLVGETLTIGEDAVVAVGLTIDPDGPNEEAYEEESLSGTVTLELLDGTIGEDGLTIPDGEGTFGAYVDVELADGGSIQGSFTATCGDNDLEIPE